MKKGRFGSTPSTALRIPKKKGLLERLGNLKRRKNSGQQVIRYDRYRLTLMDVMTGLAMGLLVDGVIAYTFYRSFYVFLGLLPLVFLYPLYRKTELKRRRLRELNLQFKEAILILASSLSAGYSIENALDASGQELQTLYGSQGLITREFAYMVQQMRMNRPVESVMMELAERSGLEDVENFARIFAVAKRSGGQLVPIINHTVGVMNDKIQVQEEIRTLTSSRQFEQKIMNLIPFFIILYIDGTSPGFFDMMYDSTMGRVIMSICLAVYLAAYLMAGMILKIEL